MENQRRRFGEFLRARRQQVTPEACGLPRIGRPRRVYGLRREEVAQLACISADYYTRLEQGRLNTPSTAVLDAIAQALRLSADDARYLRILADQMRPAADQQPQAEALISGLTTLLQHLATLPGMVVTRYLDILTWNRLAAAMFTDFSQVPAHQRNFLRLSCLHPDVRGRYRDWPSAAQDAASLMRMRAAEDPDNHRLLDLVGELCEIDQDFARVWLEQGVAARTHGRRCYIHPMVGELELEWHTVSPSGHIDQQLVYLTPVPDGVSQERLAELARAAGESNPPPAQTRW